MYKRFVVIVSVVAMLSLFVCATQIAGSQLAVGVKKGDWIEYRTVITGDPFPEHNVSRARIEILDVQGYDITTNLTSWIKNGTVQSLVKVLNPEEGEIGSWFLIAANLDVGDTFYDKNAPEPGIFTIQSVTDMTYAGATRRISYSPAYFEEFKRWDQATGIFVEGYGIYENYTLNTIADKTNMWSPQIFGMDPPLFYAVVTVIVVIVVALVIVLFARRKK